MIENPLNYTEGVKVIPYIIISLKTYQQENLLKANPLLEKPSN